MPPRIQLFTALRASNPTISSNAHTSLPFRPASTVAQRKRKHQDPYALAQARARRAANLSRQDTLTELRSKALGDPVKGVTTPFVESFDTAVPPAAPASRFTPDLSDASADGPEPSGRPAGGEPELLNHFLNPDILRQSVSRSQHLSRPVADPTAAHMSDPAELDRKISRHAASHDTATAALQRILALNNTSAKDRHHLNVQRCISTFGRHNTDRYLAARPSSHPTGGRTFAEDAALRKAAAAENLAGGGGGGGGGNRQLTGNVVVKTPRAGPDTGSSEVQVAILTAKIRSLSNVLETRGKNDKANKRNLRLLVHRRQKLLQYLRRKERGGQRWQHVTEALGLGEGTWKGEISL